MKRDYMAESFANCFRRYAERYEVTLIEAIQDRDEPLSASEIMRVLQVLGIEATEANIRECRPHSDAAVVAYETELSE